MNTFIYIETDNVGVNNKIRNQINAFNKLGVNTVGLALKKKPLLKKSRKNMIGWSTGKEILI